MNNDTIKGGFKKAEGATEKAYGSVTGDSVYEAEGAAKKLAGDAQIEMGQAKDKARRAAEHAAEDLTETANRAGRKLRGMIDSMGDEFCTATDKVTQEISQNPVRSSLIALGLGFVIGALLNR